MIEYRNTKTGRVAQRHAPDEWLEASSGWERLAPEPEPAEPDTAPEADDDNEGSD